MTLSLIVIKELINNGGLNINIFFHKRRSFIQKKKLKWGNVLVQENVLFERKIRLEENTRRKNFIYLDLYRDKNRSLVSQVIKVRPPIFKGPHELIGPSV